jgi:hypothetical protein
VPAHAVDRHADAAELEAHLVAARHVGHRRPPAVEDLVAAAGVGADSERAAEVVEDDRRVRRGPAELNELGQLGVVHPRVEAQPGGAEGGEPAPEVVAGEEVGRGFGVRLPDVRARVVGAGVADAPEAALPGLDVRSEDIGDLRRSEVGEADVPATKPSGSAATTNSVSPTGRNASGPSVR